MVLAFFPTVQLQVHNENPVRYGINTDALLHLNTKLNWDALIAHLQTYAHAEPQSMAGFIYPTPVSLWNLLHDHV